MAQLKRGAHLAQPLAFNKRGTRWKPDYGIYYRSKCGRFALYASDQVGGIPLAPVRWLAIQLQPVPSVISRHRKRDAAARACDRAARSAV